MVSSPRTRQRNHQRRLVLGHLRHIHPHMFPNMTVQIGNGA